MLDILIDLSCLLANLILFLKRIVIYFVIFNFTQLTYYQLAAYYFLL